MIKIFNEEGKEVSIVDFGMCELGKKHIFKYSIFNDSPAPVIDVKVDVNYEGIEAQYKTEMQAHEKQDLSFTWTPPLNHKQAVKSFIKIKATEVYK